MDEPIDDKATASLASVAGRLPSVSRVLTSPAERARQTVAGLSLTADVDDALRDCDYGRWSGRTLDEVSADEPEAVLSWLSDPAVAPHGGETIATLVGRVGQWLQGDTAPGGVLAVTHAAVVRAALIHILGAPAQSFWRVEVPPLAIVELRRNGGPWTIRAMRLRPASGSSFEEE